MIPVRNPLDDLTLEQLQARTSMKWRAHPPDVLPLWVAEMDVRLAPPIADALRAAVADGDTGYPPGPRDYTAALAGFANERWGWDGVVDGRTALVADVMTGIVEVLRLVSRPGDAVVVCPPVYPPFYAFVEHAERAVVEAPLGADHRLDLTALADAFVAARDLGDHPVFLLCNPHNPTGTVHTRDELQAVAELADRHGVQVVADEIHAPLVLAGAAFVPYLDVDDAGLALHSASKGFNLAGLKAALLIAGAEAVGHLERLPEEVSHGPSHLGVLAHTVAYREGGPWLDALLAGLDDNRALLAELVGRHLPQTSLVRPEATYLAWLDCTALGVDTGGAGAGPGVVSDLAGPARMFLDDARVALSSGHVFGTGGAGCVRVNFATSPAILREAVARMGVAADALTTPAP